MKMKKFILYFLWCVGLVMLFTNAFWAQEPLKNTFSCKKDLQHPAQPIIVAQSAGVLIHTQIFKTSSYYQNDFSGFPIVHVLAEIYPKYEKGRYYIIYEIRDRINVVFPNLETYLYVKVNQKQLLTLAKSESLAGDTEYIHRFEVSKEEMAVIGHATTLAFELPKVPIDDPCCTLRYHAELNEVSSFQDFAAGMELPMCHLNALATCNQIKTPAPIPQGGACLASTLNNTLFLSIDCTRELPSLPYGTTVFLLSEQQTTDGKYLAIYPKTGQWGYILADQIRKEEYIDNPCRVPTTMPEFSHRAEAELKVTNHSDRMKRLYLHDKLYLLFPRQEQSIFVEGGSYQYVITQNGYIPNKGEMCFEPSAVYNWVFY